MRAVFARSARPSCDTAPTAAARRFEVFDLTVIFSPALGGPLYAPWSLCVAGSPVVARTLASLTLLENDAHAVQLVA